MPGERRRSLAEKDKESYYNQEEWLEEYLEDKDLSNNGSESDDSDNDDDNYDKNIEAVGRRCSSKWCS